MKKIFSVLLLLFLLLLGTAGGEAATVDWGTLYLDSSNTTSYTIASGDTLKIAGAYRADGNDTSLNVVTANGVLRFMGGARFNPRQVVVGATGKLVMTTSDTLGLWLNGAGLSVTGAGGEVAINGAATNTRAVVMSMDATLRSHIIVSGTQTFNAQFCKFLKLGTSDDTPGLTQGGISNWRATSHGTVKDCLFDSTGVLHYGNQCMALERCSLLVDYQFPYAVLSLGTGSGDYGGRLDTIKDCAIISDNKSQTTHASGRGGTLVRVVADRVTILNTTIKTINANGDAGRETNGIYWLDGADTLVLKGDTIANANFGITTEHGTGSPQLTIDSCVMFGNTHEGILSPCYSGNGQDTGWTVSRSLFYDNGQSNVDIECGTDGAVSKNGKNLNHRWLYNTFVGANDSIRSVWYRYRYATGAVSVSNITMIGNIFLGAKDSSGGNDFGLQVSPAGLTVNVDSFLYNAYDSIWIDGASHFICDSDYTNTTVYGATAINATSYWEPDYADYLFTNWGTSDFTLQVGSPMINNGDSTYWINTFPSLDPATAPGDIGAFQYAAGAGEPCTASHSMSSASVITTSAVIIDTYTYDTDSTLDSVTFVWDDDNSIVSPLGTSVEKTGPGSPDSAAVTSLTASTQYWYWGILHVHGCNPDTSSSGTFTTDSENLNRRRRIIGIFGL